MASATSRRAVIHPVEKFPTEWAPYHENEREHELPVAQSQGVRSAAPEDMKAELVHALRESLDRLAGFQNAVSAGRPENLTKPEREPGDIHLLMAGLRSLEETLQRLHEGDF